MDASAELPVEAYVSSTDLCPEWCLAMHLGTTSGWAVLKQELPKLPLEKFDAYVTIVTGFQWTDTEIATIQDELRTIFAKCPRLVVALLPNVDLDVGGFFTSLYSIITSGRPYKYIYRTHSKTITSWMQSLNTPLIDGFAQCETLFADPTVGMICAASWLCRTPETDYTGYFPFIQKWLDDLGYPVWPDQKYGYSGGAVFMARLSIFRNWLTLMGNVECLTTQRHVIRDLFASIRTRPDECHAAWLYAIELWYGVLTTRSGYSIRGLLHSYYTDSAPLPTTANVYVNKPLVVACKEPLARNNIVSEVSASQHWSFDAIPYLIRNGDVLNYAQQYTKDTFFLTATRHWVMYGQFEKRQTSL